MRIDMIVDGIVFGEVTVRGMDASDAIIAMLRHMNRDDLNGILLHGTVIAGYNIIDLTEIHQFSNLPVISITKEPQEDLQTHLRSTFPSDWEPRWEIASRNVRCNLLDWIQSLRCMSNTLVVSGILSQVFCKD